MPFPDRPSGGNYDPEFGSKTEYAFPVASLAETASRNELWNGTRFPIGASNGNRVPESTWLQVESASQNAAPAFLAVVVGKGSIAYTRDDGVAVIPMAALGA